MREQDTIPQVGMDPDEVLDFGWTWTDWLTTGELISGSTWSIETSEVSPALEVVSGSETISGDRTSAAVQTPTRGVLYFLVNTITTAPSNLKGVRRIEIRGRKN